MDSDGRKGELPFKCKKKKTLAKPGSISEIDDGIGSSKSSKKPLSEHSSIKQRSQNARISCLKEVTVVPKPNAVCSVRKGKADSYRKKQVASTPADPLPQVRVKQNEDLPVKYKILDSFYEGLEAAVGLLQIRRQMCTFAAVCPTVETMTKRRFLQGHLAQMKYLFPEVVKCESVVCKDPDSHAVKRDIKITLSAFYSQPDNTNSGLLTAGGISRKWSAPTIRRRQEFHKRLLAFATSHPEGDDIPEETLIENPCSKVSKGAISLHGKPGDSHCLSAVETDPKFLDSVLDKTTDVENNVLQDDMFDPLSASETSKQDQKDPVALLEKVRRPTRNASVNTSLLHESSHFSPAFRRHFSKLPTCDDQNGAITAEKTDTSMAFENTNLECGDSHFSPAFKAHYSKMSACSSIAIQEDYALEVHELLNTSLKNQKETTLGEEVELLQKIRKPSRKMPEEADVHVKNAHFSPAFKQHFSKSIFKTTQGDEMGLLEKIHKPSREISADVNLHAENLHFSPAFKQHFSKSDLLAQDVNDISQKQDVQAVTAGEIERGSKKTGEQSEISSKDTLPIRSNDTKPDVLTAPATPLKDAKLLVEENAIEIVEQVETTSFASPLKRMLPSPFGSPLKRTMFSPVTPQNYISKEALKSPTSISCDTSDCIYTTPVCGDNNDDPSPLVHSQPIGFKIPKTPSRNSRSVEPSLERRSRVSRGLCFSDKLEDKAVLDASNMSMVSATADLCSKETKNNIQQELDLEVIKCLSPMLLQSIRQKEKRISEDRRNNVAETQRKQQMLAGLPQLFNMLRLVFQSQGRTVIPRKELLQKMESACGDITDRDELEERLQLLVENAPEWISKQTALSGELIYRVKKDADLSAIRKRLIDT